MDLSQANKMKEMLGKSPVLLRICTTAAAVMYGISASVQIFKLSSIFTQRIVGIYALVLSLCILATELSPFGLQLLLSVFPFLAEYRARGISYMIAAFLLIGRDLGRLAQMSAFLLQLCGICGVAMHYFGPTSPTQNGYTQPDQGGFDRFDDVDASVDDGYDHI